MSPSSSAAAAHLEDPVLPTSTAGSRPKRRLSNAAQAAWMDAEKDDGLLDDDSPKSRASKRSRAAAQFAGGALSGSPKQGGGAQGGVPPKALTEKEKEARRVARMIRNRNAAQASRDRKKEHILWLERRVGELEQLVRQSGIKLSAGHSPFFAGGSSAPSPAQNRPSAIPRNQREASVASDSSSSGSGRVADLEEENDSLRSQLHLEKVEKQELLARLGEVEEQLAAALRTPDATLASSFSPFSSSLVPLPYTEPTFAFDTPNLSPLPQPEELAFVEERDRQRQLGSRRPSATPESGSDGTEATQDSVTASSPSALALSASSLAGTPSLASSASSTSSRSSVLELDISSTPPATESYLDLEDAVVAPVWSDWAKGVVLPDESSGKPGAADDDAALAFLDLSAFHDTPMAIASH
ncbi:basic-leucine zipper (bZIP) transcription factor [Rhodotorula toruloides]|uniref:Basic-leucine zipper (BZIP) transcription factor n=1 Tax=Rhodotorula toruloides TaxID=5286 RepID=A0A511KIS7_RHOTO|nr:basic-leucine zipper (bZIP) transcription factor [Rhodotorula toruloides]GEM10273.1 basic-leucine zipper (bZIP) transcription factor [Rhodotorula toruloides]